MKNKIKENKNKILAFLGIAGLVFLLLLTIGSFEICYCLMEHEIGCTCVDCAMILSDVENVNEFCVISGAVSMWFLSVCIDLTPSFFKWYKKAFPENEDKKNISDNNT